MNSRYSRGRRPGGARWWLGAVLAGLLALGGAARAGTLPPGTDALVARLLPVTVAVTAVHHVPVPPPAGGQPDPNNYTTTQDEGSGFIIDKSGLIITNHHVIADADEIYVTLYDGERLRATLIYSAPIDMVILRVKADRPLPTITWGDSAAIKPGDSVIAIGNPLGIGISVSAGVISAMDRNIGETQAALGGHRDYDAFLQTDAALNHGNSGGPLFNLKGELVGVNTALISPTKGSAGLGFSIPSNDAELIVEQWRKYGRFRAGYMAATVQSMSPDIADAVHLAPPPRGVIVDTVADGGPAAKAGIRPGDVILSIRGLPIIDPRTYTRAVATTPFDTTAPVVLWRDRKEQTVQVGFIESPDSQKAEDMPPVPSMAMPTGAALNAAMLGITLDMVTPELRERFKLPGDADGVVVTNVVRNSVADDHGVRAGDVIVQANGVPVHSREALHATAVAAFKAGDTHMLVLLKSAGGGMRWVGVPLKAEEMN